MEKGRLCGCMGLSLHSAPVQMERYVYKRRQDGIFVINLEKTWEKLQLAARVIVAIENPQDVIVQSARPYGQRAVFKFAQYLNCKYSAGRHTPGTFTNQVSASKAAAAGAVLNAHAQLWSTPIGVFASLAL
jgi:small subunit ribosomal protein SAe